MSWSASATGTIAGVRASIDKQLNQCAGSYKPGAEKGDPDAVAELADIEHARSSINAQLDSMGKSANYNGAMVTASGSRGWSSALKLDVQPVALAFDPVAAPPTE